MTAHSRNPPILVNTLLVVGDISDPRQPKARYESAKLIETEFNKIATSGENVNVVLTGDAAYMGGTSQDFQEFFKAYPFAKQLWEDKRLFAAAGNHEYR